MANILRICESTLLLNFKSKAEQIEQLWSAFYETSLGQLYRGIPWQELIKALDLRESEKGRPSLLNPHGQLALMFLKNYARCSDEQLLEQLSGNIYYPLFCGILLEPGQILSDRRIVSKIRTRLSAKIDWEKFQFILAQYWGPFLQDRETVLMDATCYESEVRYPTDQKLLWEAVDWNYQWLQFWAKELKIRMPRTKFIEVAQAYHSYSRKRKKRRKEQVHLTRRLLHLLNKLNGLLDQWIADYSLELTPRDVLRRATIQKVYQQQQQWFESGQPPKQRIISLAKAYLRPIVRGKETKGVEFGAKVHKIQVDGINFIEKLDFEAFHEGNRLKAGVLLAQQLFGKIYRLGADAIYATNANRSYCSTEKLSTDFKRKGRAGKNEQQRKVLAKAIRKQRVTRLEGSFGNEKNRHYLAKVKAKTALNEQLWIYFGIHTANGLEIGRRIQQQIQCQEAA